MKKDEMKNKKELRIGIAVIVAALLILGYCIWTFVTADTDSDKNTNQTAKKTETLANDAADIDPSQAAETMNFRIQINSAVREKISNMETLQKEFSDYLVKEGFYTDVTKAACTNVITEDFNRRLLLLSFTLNNPAQTIVDVIFDQRKGSYSFQYY